MMESAAAAEKKILRNLLLPQHEERRKLVCFLIVCPIIVNIIWWKTKKHIVEHVTGARCGSAHDWSRCFKLNLKKISWVVTSLSCCVCCYVSTQSILPNSQPIISKSSQTGSGWKFLLISFLSFPSLRKFHLITVNQICMLSLCFFGAFFVPQNWFVEIVKLTAEGTAAYLI